MFWGLIFYSSSSLIKSDIKVVLCLEPSTYYLYFVATLGITLPVGCISTELLCVNCIVNLDVILPLCIMISIGYIVLYLFCKLITFWICVHDHVINSRKFYLIEDNLVINIYFIENIIFILYIRRCLLISFYGVLKCSYRGS